MMKDDDFKLLRGFDYGQTDRITDICEYRVAFVTDNTHTTPTLVQVLTDSEQIQCKLL